MDCYYSFNSDRFLWIQKDLHFIPYTSWNDPRTNHFLQNCQVLFSSVIWSIGVTVQPWRATAPAPVSHFSHGLAETIDLLLKA